MRLLFVGIIIILLAAGCSQQSAEILDGSLDKQRSTLSATVDGCIDPEGMIGCSRDLQSNSSCGASGCNSTE